MGLGRTTPYRHRAWPARSRALAVVLFGSTALYIGAVAFGGAQWIRAAKVSSISSVRITNVESTSFSVSWITDGDATGYVNYGTDPANLGQRAHDDRGAWFKDDTHHITLVGLVDEKVYYFEVVSDEASQSGYQVTTGVALGPPVPDLIFGNVSKADGTPATGTIVYMSLSDRDGSGSSGSAALLSAVVGQSGSWTANLGAARVSSLDGYFGYSASGDDLLLEAQGAADGTVTRLVDTGNDAPAAAMILSGAWTPTPSSTPTETPTHTSTSTSTPTPTATRMPSRTPTSTRTPTRTPTSTSTPTLTATRTPSCTPTSTRTPTRTPPGMPTPTGTTSATATCTATSAATATETQLPAESATPTGSPTPPSNKKMYLPVVLVDRDAGAGWLSAECNASGIQRYWPSAGRDR